MIDREGAADIAGEARPSRRIRSASTTAALVSQDLGALLDVEDPLRSRLHPRGVVAGPRPPAARRGRLQPLPRAAGAGRDARTGRRPEALSGPAPGRRGGDQLVLVEREKAHRVPLSLISARASRSSFRRIYEQSTAADDRSARQGEGHQARRHHRRHRGRDPDRLEEVLQDERGPPQPLQRGDRPDRGLRGEADRREVEIPATADRRSRRRSSCSRATSRGRAGDRVPEAHRRARPDRRADREAGDLPEGARGRARQRLRRVLRAGRRGGQRHRQAPGDGRLRRRPRPRRGAPAAQGAEPRRDLPDRRPRARRRSCASTAGAKGPQIILSPHRPRPARQAVRDGGARDLRRHRPDQGRRARGGRAGQGGRDLARARRRPGGRLRRHEGHARAVDHPRAARREDRHRRVERRPRRRS